MQMNDNPIQKTIDGLYEILELNVYEPIVLGEHRKNRIHKTTNSQKNNQVILAVPKESSAVPHHLTGTGLTVV
jgi:hypothetical protein